MNPAELMIELKGHVPLTLYNEIEYQVKRGAGKPVLDALFGDALIFLRENANAPMVKPQKAAGGLVYRMNTEDDEAESEDEYFEPFGMLSEPTEDGFVNSFHDIINQKGVEIYRPNNPLEQKGRVVAPLFLEAYPDFILEDGYRVLAVDVADMGDDKSVILARVGIHVTDIQGYYKQDTNATTGRVMDAINEHKPDEIIVDTTGGWGAGVYNNLVLLEIEELCILTQVKFNQKPRDDRFNVRNARAEIFMLLQERFREGRITIPRHKELIEELSWIKYKPNMATGQFEIVPKEICKRENKRSPDHADALGLAFYTHPGLEVF